MRAQVEVGMDPVLSHPLCYSAATLGAVSGTGSLFFFPVIGMIDGAICGFAMMLI